MKRTEIFIFRHGETDWNREKRLQGHTDIPLNEVGREQAHALEKILYEEELHAIVTSDLSRAKETAEIVNKRIRVPFFETPDLRECKLGDPEGMHRDKLIETYGADTWERWCSMEIGDDFCFPNGESKSVHVKRLTQFLEFFCKTNHVFQRIGVSTHGGSLRRIVHQCINAPTKPIPIQNCGVYRLFFNHVTGEWNFGGAVTRVPS